MPYGPIALKSFKRRAYVAHPSTLGEHLKKRRLELGLLQKQAADRLGVSQQGYVAWELRRKKPVARYVPAIINFLGYDPWPRGESLGARLQTRRREKGLTQRQAASELGIDDTTYLRYERDEWAPKRWRLARANGWLKD